MEDLIRNQAKKVGDEITKKAAEVIVKGGLLKKYSGIISLGGKLNLKTRLGLNVDELNSDNLESFIEQNAMKMAEEINQSILKRYPEIALAEALEKSSSLIELESRLSEYGPTFTNIKNYTKWIKTNWEKLNLKKSEEAFYNPVPTRFPTKTVGQNGIEYLLHGIAHGEPIYLAPGFHLRKRIKKYINKNMKSFYRPKENETYLFEEGMCRLFDLLKSQELKDVSNTSKTYSAPKRLLLYPLSLTAGVFFAAISGSIYLCSSLLKNPKQYKTRLLYLAQKSLKDENHLSRLIYFMGESPVPQPFKLEMDYLENGNFSNNLINVISRKRIASCQERSLWTAKALKKYTINNEIKKLHYLCGADHVSEIAYFLEHPSYDFSELERYKTEMLNRTKISQ